MKVIIIVIITILAIAAAVEAALLDETQKQALAQKATDDGDECSICLMSMSQQQPLQVTQCGHVFHLACIASSRTSTSGIKCPMCRRNMDTGEPMPQEQNNPPENNNVRPSDRQWLNYLLSLGEPAATPSSLSTSPGARRFAMQYGQRIRNQQQHPVNNNYDYDDDDYTINDGRYDQYHRQTTTHPRSIPNSSNRRQFQRRLGSQHSDSDSE